ANRVFTICARMSGSRVKGEELTQDVFVRTWEKLPQFRGESAFSTWLHRLAVNVVLNARKSEGRRRSRFDEEEEGSAHEAPMVLAPGDLMDLEAAIATLPPGARRIFVL